MIQDQVTADRHVTMESEDSVLKYWQKIHRKLKFKYLKWSFKHARDFTQGAPDNSI